MPDYIGKYQLIRPIGAGMSGHVYEATVSGSSTHFAIKKFFFDSIEYRDSGEEEIAEIKEDALQRFRREARVSSVLNHENVVQIVDFGETSEGPFIVMELVKGETLRNRLKPGKPLELRESLSIIQQLLSALQFCHKRDVIHRDIKPANIMVTPTGQIKVLDFGLARVQNSTLTRTGTMLGTPSCMAPEQWLGKVAGSPADIYAAGVVLYWLLTGKAPFDGDPHRIMHDAINVAPTPPSSISSSSNGQLDQIVLKALEKNPADRYRSADEFANALAAVIALPKPNAVSKVSTYSSQLLKPLTRGWVGTPFAGNTNQVSDEPGSTVKIAAAASYAGVALSVPVKYNRKILSVSSGGAAVVILILGFSLFGSRRPGPAPQPPPVSTPRPIVTTLPPSPTQRTQPAPLQLPLTQGQQAGNTLPSPQAITGNTLPTPLQNDETRNGLLPVHQASPKPPVTLSHPDASSVQIVTPPPSNPREVITASQPVNLSKGPLIDGIKCLLPNDTLTMTVTVSDCRNLNGILPPE